jgi:hypothetical protein
LDGANGEVLKVIQWEGRGKMPFCLTQLGSDVVMWKSSRDSTSTMKHRRYSLLLIVLFLVFFIEGFLMIRSRLAPSIRVTHTDFLLQQLRGSYLSAVASGQPRARSEQTFLDGIVHEAIDWNSCRFHDGVAYDSWDVPLKVCVESASIHLRSAGPDQKFDTEDDLAIEMANPLDE